MRSVIRFLNARNIKPADIHRQLCEVYGNDAINDGMVWRWVREFNEGSVSVHDEERTGPPSLINDDLSVHILFATVKCCRAKMYNGAAERTAFEFCYFYQILEEHSPCVWKLIIRYFSNLHLKEIKVRQPLTSGGREFQ
ncbi:hypothetical protein ANN_06252 [Periplaneta americana]|uniref:Mos1 transposase HTH domain-containing protein n=1 Tax=Periplaneta americana TaxID=6978 RepID=A0ABQ8TD28_PERAM|nr:hypothetical protein ANN_06252 [Periplaneta americana]